MTGAIRGSCLCGDLRFEVSEPAELLGNCHCSMCRKHHGAAFASVLLPRESAFRFTRGGDDVARFESSPGTRRAFCPRCGSAAPEPLGSGRMAVPAGCLDDDPKIRPQAHIFVASKAAWHELPDDGLPRFDGFPPDTGQSAVAGPEATPSEDGVVRGSCLCGGAAFELRARPAGMMHCHCSRCRKARSAAHATNLFGEAAAFRWLRGEDRVRAFKVPDAERFASCFCATCGSELPRVSPEGGRVVIPAGSIDGDPGARPQAHIFCASKAPWYEIPDDGLPRFDAYPT